MAKMTIHRGLSELKILNARIMKSIGSFTPTAVKQMGKIVNGNSSIEDFEKATQADYQSLRALMARKIAIKQAIVVSNSTTKVSIAGISMTVSDAITMKDEIEMKKNLLTSIAQKRLQNIASVNRGNEAVKANLQSLLLATYGKDTTKHDPKLVGDTTKTFIDLNEFNLVEPIDWTEVLANLDKEISGFEGEVDAVLSESNSTTFIEVED